jgi:hypothetical protein
VVYKDVSKFHLEFSYINSNHTVGVPCKFWCFSFYFKTAQTFKSFSIQLWYEFCWNKDPFKWKYTHLPSVCFDSRNCTLTFHPAMWCVAAGPVLSCDAHYRTVYGDLCYLCLKNLLKTTLFLLSLLTFWWKTCNELDASTFLGLEVQVFTVNISILCIFVLMLFMIKKERLLHR